MIRIAVSEDQLRETARNIVPQWASVATECDWSPLKPALLKFQHFKCAYCEIDIGGELDPDTKKRDLFEQDVDHYRPHRAGVPWIPLPSVVGMNPAAVTHPPQAGYPWLTCEETNYLASCITCNRRYKKNYFPKAHAEVDTSNSLLALQQMERPYLIHPAEFSGDEPERLIAFEGGHAVVDADLEVGSHDYLRSAITIEILGLNRQRLVRKRQKLISKIAITWAVSSRLGRDPVLATSNYLVDNEEFSSCARRYVRLCQALPSLARGLALLASLPGDAEIILESWMI